MDRKILIIQHEDDSAAGSTIPFFGAQNISYDILRIDQGAELPAQDDYSGLIVLGGEANVDEEDKYPWLVTEKKFILNFIKAEKQVLGICLGGQLIAEILGAKVYRNSFWEVGWSGVSINMNSKLPMAGEEIPGFQWHGYVFDIPHGAERILTGKNWKNQGFRYKDNVVAVQFHPEADLKFINVCATDIPTEASDTVQTGVQILQASKDNQGQLKNWYYQLLHQIFVESK